MVLDKTVANFDGLIEEENGRVVGPDVHGVHEWCLTISALVREQVVEIVIGHCGLLLPEYRCVEELLEDFDGILFSLFFGEFYW